MRQDNDFYQPSLLPAVLAVRKVGPNSHISFEGVYYSVPHGLFKSTVIVRATDSTIDILDSAGFCAASHKRCYVRRTYITDPSHMPPFYYSLLDIGCYDGAMFRKWAKHIGDKTYLLIDTLLSNKPVEEHAYKSCMAILQLSKRHSSRRLNSACGYALSTGRLNFYAVRNFLVNENKLHSQA